MHNDRLIPFLQEYKGYFRLNDIERETGIPKSTLSRAASGERGLTDEQSAKVVEYFRTIRVVLESLLKK